MIVELHDHLRPGTMDEIVGRFRSSHTITVVPAQPRRVADWHHLDTLSARAAQYALDEFRPPSQRWMVAVPGGVVDFVDGRGQESC
jgi:hypothetical protein